jgi:hypothetical protein
MANVVAPMITATAIRVFISAPAAMTLHRHQAKVMPTASASMLVATAIRNIVLTSSPAVGGLLFLCAGLPDHVPADERQQHKCDPRRNGIDVAFKREPSR